MLIDVHDIHPMTEFIKETVKYVKRLQKTHKPELLTVNGTSSIVVQDADAYQAIIERLDLLESVVRVRQAMKELDAGKGVPAEEVFQRLEEWFTAKYPSAEV